MVKILVTGGAGFIGSHVADLLIKEGHDIFIIDNLSSGDKKNVNIKARFYNEDLGDFKRIEQIFDKEKPEVVYHLAAQIDIRKSVENPAEDAKQNILNSLNLLELCAHSGVKHFIFSSTGGAIYGDTEQIPTNEKHETNPVSAYGCAKLAVEKYLDYYNNIYGLHYTILRYSNVYGPRQNAKGEAGVVSIFLDNMFKGKNSDIFGGVQTRDFVFVEDVARANLLVLRDEGNNVYNISTGKETDIIEIFSLLNSIFNNNFKAIFNDSKKGEQKRSCLSYQKIKDKLGWMPVVSLEEGLRKTYEWRKN